MSKRQAAVRPIYPAYKNGELLYARWSEDGLFYKAKVTDLLPETQSYLVVFVEYGNSQACTLADLAPLDTAVTQAAPPPLEEAVDPEVAEAQRKARVEERRLQLRAEEEAKKAVLEEKRKAVAERKARLEALEREEQMLRVEEQRRRLESKFSDPTKPSHTSGPPASTLVTQSALLSTPAKAVATSVPSTPASEPPPVIVRTPAPLSAADKARLDKRMTLSAVGGGAGAKLGGLRGVTLEALKQAAAEEAQKKKAEEEAGGEKKQKHPLDMTVDEARAARALDFGDTPMKKKEEVPAEKKAEKNEPPKAVESVVAAAPPKLEKKATEGVSRAVLQKPPPVLVYSAESVPVEHLTPPSSKGESVTAKRSMFQDEEDDQEEEDSDGTPRRSPGKNNAVAGTKIQNSLATPTKQQQQQQLQSNQQQNQQTQRVALPSPLPFDKGEADEANDSLVAREALRTLSRAGAEDTVTTTQILADLEDSLDSELAELDDLRREANEVDASISLFHQLREETYKLERTANMFASDLGDLEEEARLLLGE